MLEQSLGVGIEYGAHRFRHARGFGRGQRLGDGALNKLVNVFEFGHHQPACQRLVGWRSGLDQRCAAFDEQRARRKDPERLGGAPVVRHQGCGNVGEVGVAFFRLVEQCPGGTAHVHRIEDGVVSWL